MLENLVHEHCSASLPQAQMAALAAAELDEGEEKVFSVPGATVISAKPPCSGETAWPLQAIVQFWPLGLVLAAAPVTVVGLRRDLLLLACLRVLQESDCCRVEGSGIASIRALPQVMTLTSCRRAEQLQSLLSSHNHPCSAGLSG